MKRMAGLAAAVALAMWAAVPAAANDSTATLSVGGLQLEKTDKIAMLSEDLYLSAKEVRVRYVYRNLTNAPVTMRVAFPLPEIEMYSESPVDLPNPDDANFVNFKTLVDGQNVALTPDVRAFVNGKDVTTQIIAAGAPLMIMTQATMERVSALPKDTLAGLVKTGLLEEERYDAGKGWQVYYRPLWTLRAAFHREQTFPAGRDVVVEHRYEPVAGGSVGNLLTLASIPKSDPDRRAMVKRYCVDAAFEKAAAALAGRRNTFVGDTQISYVLKTGANWAKPIGDFRLVVDKGAPDKLVSFCATGVKKISPTQFEWRAKNFTPKQDIDVLILNGYQTE
jgi:hypothetical protein